MGKSVQGLRLLLLLLLGTTSWLPLAAQTAITSIVTTTLSGTSETADGFTFEGTTLRLDAFSSGTQSFAVAGLADQAFVRRNSVNANQSSIWYADGSGSNLLGTRATYYPDLLLNNSLTQGSDNTFANSPNNPDTGNIERLDFVFSTPLNASAELVFAVFERGAANVHDAVKIAAITAWDFVNDAPVSYGTLAGQSGNWGTVNVSSSFPYHLLRYDQGDDISSHYDTATQTQGLAGIYFTMADLGIAPGTPVYGYSLFGYDVSDGGNSANLIDYTNATFFPTDTTNSTGTGGIDLATVNGVAFFAVVPEPGLYAMVACLGLGTSAFFLRHRRKTSSTTALVPGQRVSV